MLQSVVNLVNLIFYLLDLLLRVLNHLVCILDLCMQMIGKLLFFSLLKVLLKKSLSLNEKLRLLLAHSCHRGKQVLNLLDILLGLISLSADISNVNLELGGPLSMAIVKLRLHLCSLSLDVLQLSAQLLNLLIVLLLFNVVVGVLQLLEVTLLQLVILLLSKELLPLLLGLDLHLVSMLSLLLNLLAHRSRHKVKLLRQHVQSLLSLLRLLSQVLVPVLQLVVCGLLGEIFLGNISELLLQNFSLLLLLVSANLLLFQRVFSFLSLKTCLLAIFVVL